MKRIVLSAILLALLAVLPARADALPPELVTDFPAIADTITASCRQDTKKL